MPAALGGCLNVAEDDVAILVSMVTDSAAADEEEAVDVAVCDCGGLMGRSAPT